MPVQIKEGRLKERENSMKQIQELAPDKRDSTFDDPVSHPAHYCDGGIETLDYIVAKKLDFFLGQVCKYISRAGKKDPAKELEDLKKAQFYLSRKIELMEQGREDDHED